MKILYASALNFWHLCVYEGWQRGRKGSGISILHTVSLFMLFGKICYLNKKKLHINYMHAVLNACFDVYVIFDYARF